MVQSSGARCVITCGLPIQDGPIEGEVARCSTSHEPSALHRSVKMQVEGGACSTEIMLWLSLALVASESH